jgi:protein-disulfide isomerase
MPIWRSPIVLVSALAIVGAAALVVLLNQRAAPVTELVTPSTSYAPNLVWGEVLGSAEAPVVLDVWSDFQCPFCGQFARTYLQRVVTDFVIPGHVRVVAHDVAFLGRGDPNESLDAAVAASCAADQNEYWEYHDYLFWNQNGENHGAFASSPLAAMADRLALDRATWDACIADAARATTVNQTTQRALTAGINSTPTIVVNGQRITGLPRTYEALAAAIRAVLAGPLASPSS